MATAFMRLWRSAAIWRAALLMAVPASVLAIAYPPEWHRMRLPSPQTLVAAMASSSASSPGSQEAEEDVTTTFGPFYRVPAFSSPGSITEHAYAAREASMRPVFSVTAPFTHREIPLPPGTWTTVSIGMEPSVDDGPTGSGVLLARLEGHTVTGFVLIRGSQPGAASSVDLPPNRLCDGPKRYATIRLAGPPGVAGSRGIQDDECWFIAEATFPALMWKTVVVPPALRIGMETMADTGEQIPGFFIGATYFHATGRQWIEVTYYFDTTLNGIPKSGPQGGWKPATALADPVMAAFIDRLSVWMQHRLPLLQHLGVARTPASVIDAANLHGPR